MSYNISIQRNGEVLELPDGHTEGGTYAIGGSNKAEMDVTYNYSEIFRIGNLDGLTVNDAIPILAHKVAEYGVLPTDDYWAVDKRNIGHLCYVVLLWCLEALKQQPEGSEYWRIVREA
jgi:hypothetical protein